MAGSLETDSAASSRVVTHVMLLAEDPCRVLTIRRDGDLHLPRFEYCQTRYTPELCCRDLADSLTLPSEPPVIRAVAELLPPLDEDTTSYFYNPKGNARLLLVEPVSLTDLCDTIPDSVEWTDVPVFRRLVSSNEVFFEYMVTREAVHAFLGTCTNTASSPSQPRCPHTWVHRAAPYLTSVVQDLGLTPTSNVERDTSNSIAELFRVNTEAGWYYMKSPSVATAELALTQCLARLFPDDTLKVVATNYSLHCYVAEEFEALGVLDESREKVVARKHARMQLESVKVLGVLKEAGLPDYSPSVLVLKVDEWVRDPWFSEAVLKTVLSIEEVTHTLKRLWRELEGRGIPNTLVHGDFGWRNFGFRSDVTGGDDIILFDWELARLSHPLCDLYDEYTKWSQEILNEYLSVWAGLIDMEEAARYAEMAVSVGWMVRIYAFRNYAVNGPTSSQRWFSEHLLPMGMTNLLETLEDGCR